MQKSEELFNPKSCLNTAEPDEPVFLLRATDRNAPATIYDYVQQCREDGCSEAYIEAVMECRQRMMRWQLANPGLVKQPD